MKAFQIAPSVAEYAEFCDFAKEVGLLSLIHI